MNNPSISNPVELFERATQGAMSVIRQVQPEHLALPTPCAEWSVQDLLNHMVGGPTYLLNALAGEQSISPPAGTVANYVSGVEQALLGLRVPGALEKTCQSPLGFEWTVGQAAAGTFMDQLIHTWDLGTAIGQDIELDPELVNACSAMFLPEMPELGRSAGIVGPAVAVPSDASPQALLLAAMGRQP